MNKKVNKLGNKDISSYISIAIVLLAHISIFVFVLLSARYYALELGTILNALFFVFVLLVIIDIILVVGVRYKDILLKIISGVLAAILLIGATGISAYVYRLNNSIDNVLDNSGDEQFETIAGTFVSYKKSFNDISELAGKKVGVLYETTVGTGSLGQEELENKNVEPLYVQFSTMDDLLFGLIEEEIDAGIFPSSYRQRYAGDDEVDFERYLDDLKDFYSFEKEVKTSDNQSKNLDLSSQPFNILLIGFAPETADNSYGLSDAIIVATVNPRNMKVSLTSIARDSYVPITCYGGAKDKINSARGNSRACLIDTVNDLMDTDISLYMEVNFQGIVEIVDALGGVYINNPVEFVGQTPSATRGEMKVLVPAGHYVATGEQALAFARERHAMPNGDFDRQLHQQEVIRSIATRLIDLKDVNAALKVMEAAGNNMSTNLSLNQLTSIFSYILNVKNYSGFKTSDLISIDNMRVTGYPSWTYNYSLHLPLWIYKLYNGSIAEAQNHINDVLQNVDVAKIDQPSHQRFFTNFPYYPETLYSETFDEPQVHEKMPDFVPLLVNKPYADAVSWANSMGVSLSVNTIEDGQPGFDASLSGMVLDQSPRQGALVMENPVVYLEVMGREKVMITVDCSTYEDALAFADRYGLRKEIRFVNNDGNHNALELSYTEPQYGTVFEEGQYDTLYICIYSCPKDKHTWGEWQETPCTQDSEGYRTRTCTTCGATESETIGHDFEDKGQVEHEDAGTKYSCSKQVCKKCGREEIWNCTAIEQPDTLPENTDENNEG